MFRGIFEIVTEDGMIVLPSDFRELLQSQSDDSEVLLYLEPTECAGFRIRQLPNQKAEMQSMFKTVRVDTQGRIPVPNELLRQLENEQSLTVMVVGLLDCFELLSPQELEKALQEEEEDLTLTTEKRAVLKELGFNF